MQGRWLVSSLLLILVLLLVFEFSYDERDDGTRKR